MEKSKLDTPPHLKRAEMPFFLLHFKFNIQH